jgi:putative ABC transport system permease protein
MLRATLKSLRARKLRLALSMVAVLLATMFVSGALVLSDTLGRTFDNLFANAYTYTDVAINAKPALGGGQDAPTVAATIPRSVVNEASTVPGVSKATGTILVDGARTIGKNGKVLAGNIHYGAAWTGESELLKLREGRGPTADDEVVINANLATIGKFKVGDQISVLTLKPKKTFTLVGIYGYTGGRDSIGGEQTVGFTEPVAQDLMLGTKDVYSSVNIKVAAGSDKIQVRDALRSTLGSQYTVDTGTDLAKKQSDQIKSGLSFITYLFLGFAGIAVLVGIFLILNTFSIIVAQRTQELALLRAMGASRGQMIRSVLVEAVLVGAIASALGFVVGIGLGSLGAYALANLGGKLQVAGLGVPASAAIGAFGVGIGVTVLSALIPAVRASRVPPIAALREASAPDKPLTRITIAGATVLAIGGGALGWGLSGRAHGNTLTFVFGGVVGVFIAVALLTPLLGKPVVSVLGRLFAWSVPGQLGRRNSARNPRRTAITAAAVMISIALVTGISTIFSSATLSIGNAVNKQLQADLVIAGQQTSAAPPTIDPGALQKVRGLSGVDTVAAGSYDAARVNGKGTLVGSWDDIGTAARVLKLKAVDGRIDSLASGEMLMDQKTAKARKLAVGDTLPVQLQRTPERSLRLVGIYADTQISNGIAVSWDDASRGFRSAQPVQAFVKVSSGASIDTVRQQVDDLLKDSPEVTVQTRSEYVGQSTQIFDTVLIMVQVLLGLAMLIAVLGIVNTLVLSVLERTRELGLLRAIGLKRGQAMRMITVESVVITIFGALLGITVGAALGSAVVHALKDQGFTELALPWTLMFSYVIAAAFVGVVAAIIPAIRAARLNVLGAISYE